MKEGGSGGGGGNHKNITELYGGSGKLYRDATNSFDSFPVPTPQAINNKQPLGIPPCD